MFLARIITFFLLVIIVCSTFNNNIIMLSFYCNQNYIAKTLCINRDKPQLHCNGKCQLQKKIIQQESKDKQLPDKRNENHIQVLFSKSFFAQLNISSGSIIKKQFHITDSCLLDLCMHSIFHPPQHFFI